MSRALDAERQAQHLALLATIILVVTFASPGARHLLPSSLHAKDSFPVSTFPMFSKKRPEEHRMTWVRGRDAAGKVTGQILYRIYDPGGMNQAMAHLRKARPDDPETRKKMCADIAVRVAANDRREDPSIRYDHVATVEIVDAYYFPHKVFGPERDNTPIRESVLVSCPVDRTAHLRADPAAAEAK